MNRIRIFILLLLIFVSENTLAQKPEYPADPSGKFWGYAFGDYFYKTGGDSTVTSLEYTKYKKDFNSFEFRRINVGYDYSFNENFVSTISIAYDGEEVTSDGKRTVYVRDANVKWKNIFTNSDLSFGILLTPGYTAVSEKLWGYRSFEKTIMDQRGILGSRDVGIMLNGTFDKNKTFGYYLMIGNGRGVRLENNKYKKFYGNLFYNSRDKKIIFNVYSDYEQTDAFLRKFTLESFLGIQLEKFNFGIEGFVQYHKRKFGGTGIIISGLSNSNLGPYGISFFSNGTLIENKLKYFARYDFYKSSRYALSQQFVSVGLDFTPYKKVHIMPNLWLNAYAKYQKTDVVPRITVFFDSR